MATSQGHGLTPEQVSEAVARTRAAQGLPRHVEDLRTLADLATLLRPYLAGEELEERLEGAA